MLELCGAKKNSSDLSVSDVIETFDLIPLRNARWDGPARQSLRRGRPDPSSHRCAACGLISISPAYIGVSTLGGPGMRRGDNSVQNKPPPPSLRHAALDLIEESAKVQYLRPGPFFLTQRTKHMAKRYYPHSSPKHLFCDT